MTVNGRRYASTAAPLREVGALLEAKADPHRPAGRTTTCSRWPRRTASARGRVDEVIDLVGLQDVARKRAGGFSLGMGQRLGIAAALLGDPADADARRAGQRPRPRGLLWIRDLLQRLAAEGRTVFLSAHLMSEMALTADHLIVIGRGRLIADIDGRRRSSRGTSRARPACARRTRPRCATLLRRRRT